MKKVTIITLLLIFCSILTTVAQMQSHTWYFGSRIGLKFSTEIPGPMYYNEENPFSTSNPALYCDPSTGEMLLFSDGQGVGNKSDWIFGLAGTSQTQPVLIIPNVSVANRFYVITAPNVDGAGDLVQYTELERNISTNELSFVSDLNTELTLNSCGKIATTINADNDGYWVVSHELSSKNFKVSLFNGIDAPTTTSYTVDPTYGDYITRTQLDGFFKFSPDGNYLVSTSFYTGQVCIYDFNNTTGEISFNSNYDLACYGAEFSPNSEYLYFGQKEETSNKIYQIDIINEEINEVGLAPSIVDFGALQLAPDGKIYIAHQNLVTPPPYNDNLSVIANPNEPYSACGFNFSEIYFDLNQNYVNYSLPSFASNLIIDKNESNIWMFGNGIGLNFNPNGSVNPLFSVHYEDLLTNPAIWSNPADGSVLFYTDGVYTWGADNTIQTGVPQMMGNAQTQPALIIPQLTAGNEEEFFIVTSQDGAKAKSNQINFTEIKSNGGTISMINGNENESISGNSKGAIAATINATQDNYWLVTHQINNKIFEAHLTTETGFATSVSSNCGSNWDGDSYFLKFSPSGQYLASTSFDDGSVEIYNFDNSTGEITFMKIYEGANGVTSAYGLEFSPNEEFLYVSQNTDGGRIYQIEIETANTPLNIGTFDNYVAFGALQLGPDKKIYVGRYDQSGNGPYNSYLSVINQPDELGEDANFEFNGMFYQPEMDLVRLSLPSFPSNLILPEPELDFNFVGDCAGTEASFEIASSATVVSAEWNFDDTNNDPNDNSNELSPAYTFWSGGNHFVTLTVEYQGGLTATFEKEIIINGPTIELFNYPAGCDEITITAEHNAVSPTFLWTNLTTDEENSTEQFSINNVGENIIKLVLTDATTCSSIYTETITFNAPMDIDLGEDVVLCFDESVTLTIAEDDYNHISWFNSECDGSYSCIANQTGNYWVEVGYGENCIAQDTVFVDVSGCQAFNANTSINSENVENEYIICSSDKSVTLTAITDFYNNNNCYEQTDESSTFHWLLGDGTYLTGEEITHTFENYGIYDINLLIIDVNNCEKIKQFYLNLSKTPFVESEVDKNACYGDELEIVAGQTSDVDLLLDIYDMTYPKYVSYTNVDFIPDGDGQTYSSAITIEGAGYATIIDATNISYIYVTLEHSHIAHLNDMYVECPSGETVTLMDMSNIAPVEPIIMGKPVLQDDDEPQIGDGRTYYWLSHASESITTIVEEASYPHFNYTDPTGFEYGEVAYIPSGRYLIEDDYSIFAGCPIDGEWKLYITDEFAGENGVVFDWGIAFNSDVLFGEMEFETPIWTGDNIVENVNDSTILVAANQEGNSTYSLTLSDYYECTYSGNVSLNTEKLAVNFGNDTTICEGQTLNLDATQEGYSDVSYLWSTNQTSQSISIDTEGEYWVEVSGTACEAKDTIKISVAPMINVELGEEITIIEGEEIILDAGEFEDAIYYWRPTEETTQTITVSDAAMYVVTVTNLCSTSDSVNVIVNDAPLIIPNAFTPNGDGTNDTWEFGNVEYYGEIGVVVFDKASNILTNYTSIEYPDGWDGTSKNKPLASDTYWYILKLEDGTSKSGSITIKR